MPNRNHRSHPGCGGLKVSLALLTTDQALSVALQVKPRDLKGLEEAEKRLSNGKRAK